MAYTLEDIAREANVSASTVSRVISDHPGISEATKEKVLKIMKKMNFQPNIIARSLARNSTKIIGVILATRTEGALRKTLQYPLSADLLSGLCSTAYNNGYNIVMTGLTKEDDGRSKISELVNGGITDGIIYLYSRHNDPVIEHLANSGSPFVTIGRPQNDDCINWVDNANEELAYEATEMMIKKGRRRIAFLGASPHFMLSYDRVSGYKKALLDNGIEINEELITEGKLITDDGYRLAEKLLDRMVNVDGIVAQDDMVALGAIKKLNEQGIRVPDDISIIGFNNVALGEYSTPTLTSIEVNGGALGSKACELLINILSGKSNGCQHIVVPGRIINRGSL